MGNKTALAALLVVLSAPAHPFQNFITNPFSPYPPGCATNHQVDDIYSSGEQEIIFGSIEMQSLDLLSEITTNVRVWRKGCAQDGRSVLMISFEPLEGDVGFVPLLYAEDVPGLVGRSPLRPMKEPNGWFANDSLTLVPTGFGAFVYVIDNDSFYAPRFDADLLMSPDQYNGPFTLFIEQTNGRNYVIDVPAYNGAVNSSRLPFNGRQSGGWVFDGVSDQGMLMSVSEIPGQTTEVFVFVSWYTFDDDGNQLWLVGSALVPLGDAEASIDLELVTDGVFMGGQAAARQSAGTLVLTSFSCSQIRAQWNLNGVGLGVGSRIMTRSFQVETAGYACLDTITRLQN